jgi:hypothetical protein
MFEIKLDNKNALYLFLYIVDYIWLLASDDDIAEHDLLLLDDEDVSAGALHALDHLLGALGLLHHVVVVGRSGAVVLL